MTTRHTQSNETFLPIGDVARRAGVSVDTVRKWDDLALLTSVRTAGNQRRFKLSEVETFLASQDTSTPALAEEQAS